MNDVEIELFLESIRTQLIQSYNLIDENGWPEGKTRVEGGGVLRNHFFYLSVHKDDIDENYNFEPEPSKSQE